MKVKIAGVDGGAISSNWFAEPTLSNCNVLGNIVTGDFGTGIGSGGGLSCGVAGMGGPR